jgi:hypothetical protein
MLSVAAGPLIAVSAIFLAFGAAIYLVAQGLKTLSDSIDGLQKLAEIAPSLLLAAQALTVLSASLLMLGTASTTMMLFVIPLSLTILLIDKLTNKLTNSISNINAFSQSLYNLASLASSLTLVATSLQMISQAVGSLQNYLNDNELEIIINYKLGKNLSQQNTADQLYNNNESAAQLIGQSVQEGNQYYDNNSNIDVSDITATNKEILSQLKVLTKLTKEREYEVKITNGHRIGKLIARDS